MPHDHGHILATHCKASPEDVERAVKEAARAKKEWENTPWTERAAVMLKIAELFTTEYRDLLLASTMLGQSKNVFQAQIDAVAEAADFIRFTWPTLPPYTPNSHVWTGTVSTGWSTALSKASFLR